MMVLQTMAFRLLLAQAEQPAGGGANGIGGIFSSPLLPLLVIGVMFYFMLYLPDRKKRKQLEDLLGGLKKNDQVTTSGGIRGVIVNASPGAKYVTVRIDDSNNTRIRILRSHIAQIGPEDEVVEKETDKKDNA
jgi:preprotein translocase subunit YajC